MTLIGKAVASVRRHGVRATLGKVWRRLVPPRLGGFETLRPLVAGRRGLEVGGPSPLFRRRGLIPIYPLVGALDGCNFSTETMWEGQIAEGAPFRFDPGRPPGRQYIAEASDLAAIPADRYDFVLSCHSLEHLADPLKGVAEWLRVLRPEGVLLLVVPHRDGTFDRRREVTPFDHLLADHRAGVGEDDLTHAEEFLARIDYEMAEIADREELRRRTYENLRYRGIHHHVFDTALVAQLCDHFGLELLLVEPAAPSHIVVAARKAAGRADNSRWLGAAAPYRRESPFATDRVGRE